MKKLMAMLLCVGVIFSSSMTCFASAYENEGISTMFPSGLLEATPEEIAAAEAEYDPTISAAARDSSKASDRTSWYGLGMTYYGQETSMSCGPACVRMMLKYLTGTTYSEATIRNNTKYSDSTGTTLANQVSYLNSEQSVHRYIKYYGSSLSYIMDGYLVAIRDNSAPPICGLREQYAYGFPYNGAGGHSVVIHQVAADQSAVELYDPWAGYVSEPENKSYEVSAQNLYSAYCMVLCGTAF